MGLLNKKKQAAEPEEKVRGIQASDVGFDDGTIIDPNAVAKAEKASSKPKKSEGDYNVVKVRRLKKWQKAAIVVCVVFMLGTLFVTGRTNGTRTANLNTYAAAIQTAKNELIQLQTTGDAATTVKTDMSAYHNADQQATDDLRMTQLLNGMLRWDSETTRTNCRLAAETQYHPEESFLNMMFNTAADYAGYKYPDDDVTAVPTEMNAVSNFVSSMTGMVAGVSRSYDAILDFTYGSNDGHLYTQTVFITYTVYSEGAVSGLTAQTIAKGTVK